MKSYENCYEDVRNTTWEHNKTIYEKEKNAIAKLSKHTLDFFLSNLGLCLELRLLNSETEIGARVA